MKAMTLKMRVTSIMKFIGLTMYFHFFFTFFALDDSEKNQMTDIEIADVIFLDYILSINIFDADRLAGF